MSILQRIAERQQGAMQQMEVAQAEQVAEAEKPDAVAQSGAMRAEHRASFRSMPDRELREEPAGQEEQALHETLERQMIEMVNSQAQGATEGLLRAVTSAEDPVQGVGLVASDIVQSLKQQHPEATQDILLSVGERTVEEIVELVEVAQPRLNFDDDDMAEAVAIGIEQYNDMNRSEVDEDELRGFLAGAQ